MKPEDAWSAACNQLQLQLDRASYDTWLRDAVFLSHEADTFVIGVRNDYAQEMLQHRLYRSVRRVLSSVCGYNARIEFVTNQSVAEKVAVPVKDPSATNEMPLFELLSRQNITDEYKSTPAPRLHDVIRKPESAPLPESDLNPRYTFDRFIVSGSNQVVFEAARAVAEYPSTVYNPFLMYGGVGLGKTHLLQAIGEECARRGLKVIYIPSEAFTNDLVTAIRNRTTAMFREKYRTVDVLLVDDIQFISGKETTQEEFFHTFNALVNFNKQIVLASDRHPSEMATLEDRLRSRFQGGLVADIQPPELETRIAILEVWAHERNVDLPKEVIGRIAQRAPRNVRELEGMFNQIVAKTRLLGEPVTVLQADDALNTLSRSRSFITLNEIIDHAARYQGVMPEDLVGKKRTGRINHARQIAMYVARELTDYSLPQIGEAFGGRSHTTVLHGYRKISDELEYDQVLSMRVQELQSAILGNE